MRRFPQCDSVSNQGNPCLLNKGHECLHRYDWETVMWGEPNVIPKNIGGLGDLVEGS